MRRYCPDCGERRLPEGGLSARQLAHSWFAGAFSLDNRFWMSMRTLLTRPGQITADAIVGRRSTYMRLVQTFLLCNLIYFLAQPWTGVNTLTNTLESHLERQEYSTYAQKVIEAKEAELRVPVEIWRVEVGQRLEVHSRSLVVALAPAFALLLAVIMVPRRRDFAVALHFALEFLCFVLLHVLIVWMLVIKTLLYDAGLYQRAFASWADSEQALTVLGLLIPVWWWSQRAFQTVYACSRREAAIRAAVFTALLIYPIHLFRLVVFLSAVHAS
jgi:hypothetical protein